MLYFFVSPVSLSKIECMLFDSNSANTLYSLAYLLFHNAHLYVILLKRKASRLILFICSRVSVVEINSRCLRLSIIAINYLNIAFLLLTIYILRGNSVRYWSILFPVTFLAIELIVTLLLGVIDNNPQIFYSLLFELFFSCCLSTVIYSHFPIIFLSEQLLYILLSCSTPQCDT